MSRSRMINTRFWDDDYTSNLDPIEKLLFLYFLSNTSTNICGVYEIPIKKVAMETGIDKEMVLKVVERFSNDGKVFYFKGWLCMKNFVKNQNQGSPQVKKGIEREITAVPKDILDYFTKMGYGIDTLSHLTKPNLTKLNLTQPNENVMYNYEEIDSEGNPTQRKNLKKIDGSTNKFLISVGIMWRDTLASHFQMKPEDVVLLNIYYPIRHCYDREKFTKDDFKDLFTYFLADRDMKEENKLSFDLCLSQKYVAKFKLAKKLKKKTNASISSEIEL